MSGIVNKSVVWIKQMIYLGMQGLTVVFYWKLKLIRTQVQKWKKCGVQKRLEKTYSGLGAEIYALHKQDQSGWEAMPSVQQQLRYVEEVEGDIFRIDEAIEALEQEYLTKKDEIKDSYASKRAEAAEADE